jgi:peptide/nickel transport system permease protein
LSHYIIRRLLWLIPVFFGVTLIVFGIMKLIPGDAAEAMVALDGTPEDVENMRRVLGLDQPVYVQYGKFLERVVQLDLGNSNVTRRPVTQEISSRLVPTAELAVAAFIFAVFVGMPAGIIAATFRYSIWDSLATIGAVIGVSMPIFWFGLMLMMIFSVWLGVLPSSGAGSIQQLVLPAITLGSVSTAIIARQTRSSMVEVMGRDYIRTARAKGLVEYRIVLQHALKNAMIPTVTVAGLQVGYLLGGSVLTETVFARPGLGSMLVESIRARDIPMVQGTILFLAVIFVLVNLIVDLIYVKLDPRITYN